MRKENLDESLINTIASDNLKEITLDGAEIALDNFLGDGLLKELPFFGTFYKGFKTVLGIRETIFIKKMYKFLTELKDISTEQRQKFIEKLESENEYKHKVGEKLITIMEHIDDIDKPTIIGKLFKFTISGDLDYENFLRLSSIVQNSFLPDLMKLKPCNNKKGIRELTEQHFYQLGIMDIKLEENTRDLYIMESASFGGSNKITLPPIMKYELNGLGKQLIKYGLTEV